nr:hypothetical protein 3 [bacterium]
MASVSYAGPDDGREKPGEVIVEEHDEFDTERLFIGWSGNGYQEDTCWLLVDSDIICKLPSWE